MLIKIIRKYLSEHSKIVIPQLGTFIVRPADGAVLFSELLRRDDGVLRGLLCDSGVTMLEAAGEIDRFVFEVRHTVEHGGEFPMSGFGVFLAGANNTIAFRYDPAVALPETEPDSVGEPETETVKPAPVAEPAPESVAEPAVELDRDEMRRQQREEQNDRVIEAVRNAFSQPYISPSAKMNPDPSVRGLRYGKPPKNTDGYSYVDQAPRRRTDWFIWLAVVVAAIAIAAIAFGYWRDARDRQIEEEFSIEIPVPVPTPAPSATDMLNTAPAIDTDAL